MDQSPAVESPRSGDPITAAWAARVADAANAVPKTPEAVGSFASPFGSVTPATGLAMLGARAPLPMPFDIILAYNENTGANEAFVALYNDTVWILNQRSNTDVFYPSTRDVQAGSEAVVTATGLARLPGFVDGAHNYFVVWFKKQHGARNFYWDIVAQQNTNRPAWSDEKRIGPVVIAEYSPSGTGQKGLRQFHRGLLWYNVSWVLGPKGTVADNACTSLGTTEIYDTNDQLNPASATKAISFDGMGVTRCHEGLRVLGGEVNLQTTGNEITLNGNVFTPQTVTIGGNSYTILAKS